MKSTLKWMFAAILLCGLMISIVAENDSTFYNYIEQTLR